MAMISLSEIKLVGHDLHRPECVHCTKAGFVYVSDWRGGVTRIGRDGSQTSYLAGEASFQVKPNGFAILPDGSFLLAHLGAEAGGVFQLKRSGELMPFVLELDGEVLPPTNYVHLDPNGRIWITVSTRLCPRSLAYTKTQNDGFILLKDNHGVKVVADELGYTNECAVSPCGRYLYVNETFARRLSRFRIEPAGRLSKRETITEFGEGVFPDGLTYDQEGRVWITSIVSNRVIRIDPSGKQEVMIEDSDSEFVQWVEEAFQRNELGRPHLDSIKSNVLKNISSLAFGGANLDTAWIGCLLGQSIYEVQLPVRGVPPTHWMFEH